MIDAEKNLIARITETHPAYACRLRSAKQPFTAQGCCFCRRSPQEGCRCLGACRKEAKHVILEAGVRRQGEAFAAVLELSYCNLMSEIAMLQSLRCPLLAAYRPLPFSFISPPCRKPRI